MRKILAILLFVGAWAAQAQDFPTFQPTSVLIVSQETLFSESALGKDILALEQSERDALIEESRQIGADFVAEEQELTDLRDTLAPEEFKKLADAFDEKVVAARAAQDANDSTLIANIEARRRAFYRVIAPVLARLMQQYNASVIIDRRTVLLFDTNLDITSEAVQFLDNAYSENPDMINQLGTENE